MKQNSDEDEQDIQQSESSNSNIEYNQSQRDSQQHQQTNQDVGNTFLTGIGGDDNKQTQQQIKGDIDIYVQGIDQQFKTVMSKHEEDFFNAYKLCELQIQSHMMKVQKELQYLHNKKNEAEGLVMNDENVVNLQKSIDWFKNEAVKLDQILEGQKRELQKHKNRENNVKDDNQFLESQVKEAMKHNKMLSIAVEKKQNQSKLLREFLNKNGQKNQKQHQKKPNLNQTTIQELDEQTKQDIQSNLQENDQVSMESQDFRVKDFVMNLFQKGYSKEEVQAKIVKFFKAYDKSRDYKISKLQNQLEQEKKTTTKLKNSQVNDYQEKADVENLFLDCVDEFKKEVLRKKTLLLQQDRKQNDKYLNKMLLEDLVLNKETLTSVYESMFGNQNNYQYENFNTNNFGQKSQNKSFYDASMAYMSNTTKDQTQFEEIERSTKIMNEPIENLINMSASNSSFYGIRKRSQPINAQRAQTAKLGFQRKQRENNSKVNISDIYQINEVENNLTNRSKRAQTSHVTNRVKKNRVIANNDIRIKSRQGKVSQISDSQQQSFSVKNGKLIIDNKKS